ncbi:MAG: hypothetical protein AAB956_02365 [Patescibacteria group bacterium]
MKRDLKKGEKKSTFSGLSAREQKAVIKSAARVANRDQRELIKRYAETFGSAQVSYESN